MASFAGKSSKKMDAKMIILMILATMAATMLFFGLSYKTYKSFKDTDPPSTSSSSPAALPYELAGNKSGETKKNDVAIQNKTSQVEIEIYNSSQYLGGSVRRARRAMDSDNWCYWEHSGQQETESAETNSSGGYIVTIIILCCTNAMTGVVTMMFWRRLKSAILARIYVEAKLVDAKKSPTTNSTTAMTPTEAEGEDLIDVSATSGIGGERMQESAAGSLCNNNHNNTANNYNNATCQLNMSNTTSPGVSRPASMISVASRDLFAHASAPPPEEMPYTTSTPFRPANTLDYQYNASAGGEYI